MIEKGNTVSVHYTGKHEGKTFDSSVGGEPLQFQIGEGQLIKGFEDAVLGKQVGDKIIVNIQPSEGYGEFREDLLIKVDKTQMPGEVEVGMVLEAQGPYDQPIQVTVKEINEDHVIIDSNHIFAGKELEFEIEIIEIQ